MITDNELSGDVLSRIWNSFFHFFLDEKSHSFLITQCRTLIEVSGSIATWNDSKYSKFIRMCNVNTLLELRRHWELYVQAGQLSSARKKQLKEMVLSSIKTTKSTRHKGSDLYPCRSAGPYFLQSAEPASKVFHHFWKTGITSLSPQHISAATLVNPSFVYSLTGEGFALHYGTTPISPFHLAPAFLNSKRDTLTMQSSSTTRNLSFPVGPSASAYLFRINRGGSLSDSSPATPSFFAGRLPITSALGTSPPTPPSRRGIQLLLSLTVEIIAIMTAYPLPSILSRLPT